jgi:hypothetical protein
MVDGTIAPLLSVLPMITGLAYLAPWLIPVQVVIATRSSALVRTRLEDIEAEVRRLGSERPEVDKALADLDALAKEIAALRAELADVRIGGGGTAELDARLVALEQREAARLDSFRIGMSAIAHGSFADEDEVRRACARFAGNAFAGAAGSQVALAALSILPLLTGDALRFLGAVHKRAATANPPRAHSSVAFADAGIRDDVALLEAIEALGLVQFERGGVRAVNEYSVALTSVGRGLLELTQ